jgi:ABC-2 type transport system permease protein
MSRPVSRLSIIGLILKKDLTEYSRDRLWMFLTLLVLFFMIIVFWVLPGRVDESIPVGISGLGDPAALASLQSTEEEGLRLVAFDTAADLRSVVAGEADAWQANAAVVVIPNDSDAKEPDGANKTNVDVGLAFPSDFLATTAAGNKTTVEIFVDAQVPEELKSSMSSFVKELAFTVAGSPLPVDTANPQEVYTVLGQDRAGNQVTPRESFRPLLVFLVLVMEMFGMSSLIAREVQTKTVTALLVTPATTGDVLAAKGIAGAVLGLGQAVILLAAIDVMGNEPLLIVTLMLLGAVMVSGTAMVAGSLGRDFLSNLFYGVMFMVPLMIPAFTVLFPGTASGWIRVLPSYPLVQGLVKVATYGEGWAEALPDVGALAAWCVALFVLGWFVLKRKVETL